MTESVIVRLNREIVQRYGNPEVFRKHILLYLGADWGNKSFHGRISKRSLALRSGLCYTHVLKVLNGKVKPRLETMLLLDEALDQLIKDRIEEND